MRTFAHTTQTDWRDDMGATKNVTIQDVALKANVSISTVSRVLNEPTKVSDGTLEHVRQVINELGYVPNPTAKRLARTRAQAGETDADPVPPERTDGGSTPSVIFEGAWTSPERAALSEAITQRGDGGLWICVKTRPGADVLFAVARLEAPYWSATGNTIEEVTAQIPSDSRERSVLPESKERSEKIPPGQRE